MGSNPIATTLLYFRLDYKHYNAKGENEWGSSHWKVVRLGKDKYVGFMSYSLSCSFRTVLCTEGGVIIMKALYSIVLATGIIYWGVKIFQLGETVGEFKAQCKEVKKTTEELRESLKK